MLLHTSSALGGSHVIVVGSAIPTLGCRCLAVKEGVACRIANVTYLR